MVQPERRHSTIPNITIMDDEPIDDQFESFIDECWEHVSDQAEERDLLVGCIRALLKSCSDEDKRKAWEDMDEEREKLDSWKGEDGDED